MTAAEWALTVSAPPVAAAAAANAAITAQINTY
jgi:hypothetical protein